MKKLFYYILLSFFLFADFKYKLESRFESISDTFQYNGNTIKIDVNISNGYLYVDIISDKKIFYDDFIEIGFQKDKLKKIRPTHVNNEYLQSLTINNIYSYYLVEGLKEEKKIFLKTKANEIIELKVKDFSFEYSKLIYFNFMDGKFYFDTVNNFKSSTFFEENLCREIFEEYLLFRDRNSKIRGNLRKISSELMIDLRAADVQKIIERNFKINTDFISEDQFMKLLPLVSEKIFDISENDKFEEYFNLHNDYVRYLVKKSYRHRIEDEESFQKSLLEYENINRP